MTTVTLTKHTPDYTQMSTEPTGFPVTIKAVGVGIPSEIFVYKNKGDGDYMFTNIAALYELADLSTVEYSIVENETEVPYVRRDEVSLVMPSIDDVNVLWDALQADVRRLVKDYNNSMTMDEVETATISES